MSAWIVGIGAPWAGDDAVALHVLDRLVAMPLPAATRLAKLREPSELATELRGAARALVVDALLDPEHAGHVQLLDGATLAAWQARSGGMRSLSSHGVDVFAALELGRTLDAHFPPVDLLAISIAMPVPHSRALSPAAAAAVETAVDEARRWAELGP